MSYSFDLTTITVTDADIEEYQKQLCDDIYKVVERFQKVTFAELVHIENFMAGDEEYGFPLLLAGNDRIAIWTGVTYAALLAVEKLMGDRIFIVECSAMLYVYDGFYLDLPLISNLRKRYKKRRWLPVEICTMEYFKRTRPEEHALIEKVTKKFELKLKEGK